MIGAVLRKESVMQKYDNNNAAKITVSNGKSEIILHEFQEAAMLKMNEYNKKDEFN